MIDVRITEANGCHDEWSGGGKSCTPLGRSAERPGIAAAFLHRCKSFMGVSDFALVPVSTSRPQYWTRGHAECA